MKKQKMMIYYNEYQKLGKEQKKHNKQQQQYCNLKHNNK